MLRPLAWLTLMLLTLAVVTPAALACDMSGDCCPPQSPPCNSTATQLTLCCQQQPIVASALASLVQCEQPSADNAAPPTPASGASAPVYIARHAVALWSQHIELALSDQQQLYLQTGRLRL